MPLNATAALTPGHATEQLSEIFGQISERVQAGETIDVEDYLVRYPQYAEQLRRLLPTMTALNELGYQEAAQEIAADGPAQIVDPSDRTGSMPPAALRNGVLGDFRIIREIGRGGMGIVYEAEQLSLLRRVALKILPFAAMLSDTQLTRFKNEARAAATLKHRNIVSVYSVGCERGVHHYAMELIEGASLADVNKALRESRDETQGSRAGQKGRAESGQQRDGEEELPAHLLTDPPTHSSYQSQFRNPRSQIDTTHFAALSTQRSESPKEYYRTVARWGVQAAEALAYAHENGVLHRDIKPANLLVDKCGDLWITDFGLARLESSASLTASGEFLGTLRYMSPEQALGKRGLVDHRSDIYSLGVTLYELLTLQPAFSGTDRQELLHQIAFEQPKTPRQIDGEIPRDLETILLKATAKDAQARYPSAQEFAEDLQRFNEQRPIFARRQCSFSKTVHWVRRNRAVATLAGLAILLLLTVAIGGSITAFQQANLAARLQDTAREQHLFIYARDVQLASRLLNEGNHLEAQDTLLNHVPSGAEPDLRGFEWYHLWHRCLDPAIVRSFHHELPLKQAKFIDNGRELAASGFGRQVAVWSLDERRPTTPRMRLECPTLEVDCVLELRESGRIITGDKDGNVCLFDRSTGEMLNSNCLNADSRAEDVISLAVDASERLLVVGTRNPQGGAVHLWDLTEWRLLSSMQTTSGARAVIGPNDQCVVLGVNQSEMTVFPLEAGIQSRSIPLHWPAGTAVAVSPDRSTIAAALRRENGVDPQYKIELWDTASWEPIWSHHGADSIRCIAYSHDGGSLAFGDEHGRVWIVDLSKGAPQVSAHRRMHCGELNDVGFSPDGSRLVTCGADGFATVWDTALLSARPDGIVSGPESSPMSYGGCFLDRQGMRVVTTQNGDGVQIWDAMSGEVLRDLSMPAGNAPFMASAPIVGRCCILAGTWPHPSSGDPPSRVLVWDDGRNDFVCDVELPMNIGNSMTSCAISPDGNYAGAPANYRFNVFRLGGDSQATHELRPCDLWELIKLCQVLAFAIVDDGWIPVDTRNALSELFDDLDALVGRWGDTIHV